MERIQFVGSSQAEIVFRNFLIKLGVKQSGDYLIKRMKVNTYRPTIPNNDRPIPDIFKSVADKV